MLSSSLDALDRMVNSALHFLTGMGERTLSPVMGPSSWASFHLNVMDGKGGRGHIRCHTVTGIDMKSMP